MLTSQQVQFIESLSGGACFGVVMGAVCGLLVTTTMFVKQGRRGSGVEALIGILHGVVPGAVAAAITAIFVAAITTTLEMTFCEPGPKGSYVLPKGLEPLILVSSLFVCLFPAAIAARLSIPDVEAKRQHWHEIRRSAIRWSAIGALIGAIAGVGWGFDGYFVVQTNSGPICGAIAGAAFLAIGCLLWRLTIAAASASADSSEQRRWMWLCSHPHIAIMVAWLVLLFMFGISVFGTVGVALILGTAVWVGVILGGQWNVRLAWLCFIIFCAFQPLLVALSSMGWSFTLSDSNAFPELGTIRDALHLLSLALCGPLIWAVVNMRWDAFNPMLYILALPSAALLQGSAVWWIGDVILRRWGTLRRSWLAVLAMALLILFGCTFIVHYHLL